MLSKRMLKALNAQITAELYSSYLYLQMSGWFDANSLPGFATWMKVQAQEEIAHAMIFINYQNERGGSLDLGEIKKPKSSYASAQEVFEATLTHEQTVTASINNLMDIAIEEKDYATRNRLEWFIGEQVEEEANPTEIINKLKLIGKNGNGVFMLDKELGARIFTPPAPLAAGN